jgi:hypothetical protein
MFDNFLMNFLRHKSAGNQTFVHSIENLKLCNFSIIYRLIKENHLMKNYARSE